MVKIFPKWPLLLQLLRVYSNKIILKSSLVAQTIVSAYNAGDLGSIPKSGRSFGEGLATHSSTVAWKIPQTEESDRLQSMGSQRVGHDQATSIPYLTFFFPYLTLKSLTPQVKRLKTISQSQ